MDNATCPGCRTEYVAVKGWIDSGKLRYNSSLLWVNSKDLQENEMAHLHRSKTHFLNQALEDQHAFMDEEGEKLRETLCVSLL